jgi:hypothetical protein
MCMWTRTQTHKHTCVRRAWQPGDRFVKTGGAAGDDAGGLACNRLCVGLLVGGLMSWCVRACVGE